MADRVVIPIAFDAADFSAIAAQAANERDTKSGWIRRAAIKELKRARARSRRTRQSPKGGNRLVGRKVKRGNQVAGTEAGEQHAA